MPATGTKERGGEPQLRPSRAWRRGWPSTSSAKLGAVDSDPLDPDFRSIADEALRLEPGVRVSTLTKDFTTTLIIETTGLTAAARQELSDAHKAHRRRHDLVGEFMIAQAEGGEFVKKPDVPSGWPPAE